MIKEHRIFICVLAVITSIFTTISITYVLYLLQYSNFNVVLIVLKPIPVILLILQCLIYMKLYNYHNYAIGLTISLMFFSIGDILLGLYSYYNLEYLKQLFFMIGLFFFLIGRICFISTLFFSPYKSKQLKTIYQFKKWHLMNLFWFVLTIIYLYIIIYNLLKTGLVNANISTKIINIIAIILYSLITTNTCIMSILRYKLLYYESKISLILCILGTSLFGMSDLILGYTVYVKDFDFSNIYIISIYWMGMLLLSWSIVRNWESDDIEKNGTPYESLINYDIYQLAN